MAHQAGDILVRGGLAFVSPQTSSDSVLGTGELEIDSNMQLGLTLLHVDGQLGLSSCWPRPPSPTRCRLPAWVRSPRSNTSRRP